MIDAAGAALLELIQPLHFAMMLTGVAAGLVIGVLPGLGGAVGMSMLLPFVFGLEPNIAMPLLIGMAAVISTSDTFPSVLLGVPGSAGSQATIMDGYPLAQQGQAAQALSAAFFASLAGGLIGAVVLFLVLPIARPIVLAFGSPELLMLSLLGLSMAGVLAGQRPVRGILAACIGLFIGSMGAAPATAYYRYTFGSLYLWDGVPIAVVALGLFALPEILDLLAENRSISKKVELVRGWKEGFFDVLRHKWLVVRCASIGLLVGVVPGLGGAVVDWVSYGQAVQVAKDKSRFGDGDIRGVIAPESSNNAKDAGALIPTLLFGIPGSGMTAVLLGAFILLGLDPGPRMITNNLDTILIICWTFALANIFGAFACLMLSPQVARLSLIAAPRLAPVLLVIMLVGAYQSTRSWGDIAAFIIIGLLGWVMKHLGWSRAPLLIGYVLSVTVERYLWISVNRFGWEWLLRPMVIVLGALTVVLIFVGVRVRGSLEKRAD